MLIKSRSYAINFALLLLMAMFVGNGGFPDPFLTLVAFLSKAALAFAIYILNDLTDSETDTVNNINRPIQKQIVSRNEAKIFVSSLIIFGLISSLFIDLTMFILHLGYLVLGVAYSLPRFGLKQNVPIKSLTVGFGAFLTGLSGGAAVGIISPQVIFFSFFAFVLVFILATVGDMEDIEGDASAGVRSLPVILGPKRTAEVLLGTIVGVAIMLSLLHNGLGFNPLLTLPVGLFACWLGIRYLWKLLQSPSSIADCLITRKKLRLVYMMLQFALVLGAFNP